MSLPYSRAEERALLKVLAGEDAPRCPVCGASLDVRDLPPREGIAYVRRRLWVVCPGCMRTAAVDWRAVERVRDGHA